MHFIFAGHYNNMESVTTQQHDSDEGNIGQNECGTYENQPQQDGRFIEINVPKYCILGKLLCSVVSIM